MLCYITILETKGITIRETGEIIYPRSETEREGHKYWLKWMVPDQTLLLAKRNETLSDPRTRT